MSFFTERQLRKYGFFKYTKPDFNNHVNYTFFSTRKTESVDSINSLLLDGDEASWESLKNFTAALQTEEGFKDGASIADLSSNITAIKLENLYPSEGRTEDQQNEIDLLLQANSGEIGLSELPTESLETFITAGSEASAEAERRLLKNALDANLPDEADTILALYDEDGVIPAGLENFDRLNKKQLKKIEQAQRIIDQRANEVVNLTSRRAGVIRGAFVRLKEPGDTLPDTLQDNLLVFQYNPSMISNRKGVDYAENSSPQTYQKDIQYVGGRSRVFSFVLELNAYGDSDIHIDFSQTRRLNGDWSSLVDSAPERKLNYGLKFLESLIKPRNKRQFWSRTPSILFLFGVNTPLKCLVRDISFDYTLFDPDLKIMRASCQIELEYVGEELTYDEYVYFPNLNENRLDNDVINEEVANV